MSPAWKTRSTNEEISSGTTALPGRVGRLNLRVKVGAELKSGGCEAATGAC